MHDETNNVTVSDNPRELRYELHVGGALVGEIRYRRLNEETVVLVHTEVDPSLEGEGLGAVLVRGALEDIRARGRRLVPVCPFVAAYIRHHPEYSELVTTSDETPD
jgi:predicted GNAT family acetyltransferase